MSLLPNLIPEQEFEKVRDRIGVILALEIPAQAALIGDTTLNATIFSERSKPFDKTDMNCINVLFSGASYENQKTHQNDGDYTYFVDVYAKAKTTATEKGEESSSRKLHRILGLCRAILESPVYRTLGFALPSLSHTTVVSIQITDPANNQDASSIMMGRLTFRVRVKENQQLIENSNNFAEYETSVTLQETPQGFIFTQSN